MNIEALSAPFDPHAIHWRVGATTLDKKSGLALAYLDARDVMKRLDDVCGPENWQNKYRDCGNGRLACELLIRIGDEWIGKSDGAGETQVEGEKGAFSGALKRAAVCWGIGRYLYDLPATWVKLNDRKQIVDGEIVKLRRSLTAMGSPLPPDDLVPDLDEFQADVILTDAKKCESKAQLRSLFKKWTPAFQKAGMYLKMEEEFQAMAEPLPNVKGRS